MGGRGEWRPRRTEGREGFVLKLRHFDLILEDIGSHWAVEQQDEVFFKLLVPVEEAGRSKPETGCTLMVQLETFSDRDWGGYDDAGTSASTPTASTENYIHPCVSGH